VKVLLVHNFHRQGGGSDDAVLASAELLREGGDDVRLFQRDSRNIVDSVSQKVSAFAKGIYAPRSVKELRRELESFAPDVIHVHELYPLISPWVLPACRAARVPIVMTCHDYRLTCPIATHYSHGRICTDCIEQNERKCGTNNCRGNHLKSAAYAARAASARLWGLVRDTVTLYVTPTRFAAHWLATHGAFPLDRLRLCRTSSQFLTCPQGPPQVATSPTLAVSSQRRAWTSC